MVHSPEVSWAPPQSPLPSPLGSPLPEAAIPASPRRMGFRERLSEMAAEYEELQARCERLAAENRDLRARLAAPPPDGDGRHGRDAIVPMPGPTVYATDDKDPDGGDLHDPLSIEDKEGKDGREPRDARKGGEGSRGADRDAERNLAKQSEGGGGPGAHRGSARGSGDGGGAASGDDESGSSGSSSGSEGGHSHGKRGGGRRRKHRRRHSHGGGHRRRRRHGRSRSRSGRSRSRRGKSPPRRDGGGGPLVARGLYGSGDHRRDVEDFCMKNQLEARVISALKSMPESRQRKVMGTDGGENSYLLIDRVKNPNAVVMSRIRKIEAE